MYKGKIQFTVLVVFEFLYHCIIIILFNILQYLQTLCTWM